MPKRGPSEANPERNKLDDSPTDSRLTWLGDGPKVPDGFIDRYAVVDPAVSDGRVST